MWTLKLEVATLRIILDGAAATSGVVKWYGSIATHQYLAKTMAKTL